jgi:hypothetical protein
MFLLRLTGTLQNTGNLATAISATVVIRYTAHNLSF